MYCTKSAAPAPATHVASQQRKLPRARGAVECSSDKLCRRAAVAGRGARAQHRCCALEVRGVRPQACTNAVRMACETPYDASMRFCVLNDHQTTTRMGRDAPGWSGWLPDHPLPDHIRPDHIRLARLAVVRLSQRTQHAVMTMTDHQR